MPTLVPSVEDRLIYFVLCDYGPKMGQAWAETDPEKPTARRFCRGFRRPIHKPD